MTMITHCDRHLVVGLADDGSNNQQAYLFLGAAVSAWHAWRGGTGRRRPIDARVAAF
jgi:hypothetical protein